MIACWHTDFRRSLPCCLDFVLINYRSEWFDYFSGYIQGLYHFITRLSVAALTCSLSLSCFSLRCDRMSHIFAAKLHRISKKAPMSHSRSAHGAEHFIHESDQTSNNYQRCFVINNSPSQMHKSGSEYLESETVILLQGINEPPCLLA